MAKGETCVLTNMCMVYDGNGNVLVQDKINPDWQGNVFWLQISDLDRYTWVPDFIDMLAVFQNDEVSELYY